MSVQIELFKTSCFTTESTYGLETWYGKIVAVSSSAAAQSTVTALYTSGQVPADVKIDCKVTRDNGEELMYKVRIAPIVAYADLVS
jgi:hypothetical protein